MYIEDDKFDRLAFERFMREVEDIEYKVVNTLREARKVIEQQELDIIVTDYLLSDGLAFDVLELAREIPVVVTAGAGSEEVAVKLMRAGARDYLIKDVDHNYLKILPVVIENTLKHIQDQKALIKSQLELEQAIELQHKKDEFIGIASHELKTPLTSVKAYIQLMEHQLEGEQVDCAIFKRYINKTVVYVNKLESLINNLLDVSKLQAGKMQYNFEELSLDELIKEAVDGAKHLFNEHHFQVTELPGVKVKGDKIRLEQVLMNYLTNAVKYSPGKNEIFVRSWVNDGYAVVAVQDQGIGISKEAQSRVFDRFYRVSDISHRFSGLGVGLYISREIISRHNGKVWVESEEGKGSTFYFSIPV